MNLSQDQDDVEGNVHNIGLLQEARGQNHSYGIKKTTVDKINVPVGFCRFAMVAANNM